MRLPRPLVSLAAVVLSAAPLRVVAEESPAPPADPSAPTSESAPIGEAAPPRDSVVKIEVKSRNPDPFRPWTKQSPSSSSGSGVVIDGGRILTNAHVVRFASQIEVQPHGSSTKIESRIVAIAPAMDLALLEPVEKDALEGVPPMERNAALPRLRQAVTVLGYPLGGEELSITEGIVSRIEFSSYYYNAQGLRVQIDAALNRGNSGGPAVSDGKLIGLVFSKIDEADNIGYLIPTEEVEAFLADVADGAYDSKATIAGEVALQLLENPALRQRLKLDDETTGLLVKRVEAVPDGSVQEWDVVTHIGPHAIDNQGFVRIDDELRLNFGYYLNKLLSEDKVPLTVVRDGKTLELQVPIERSSYDLVPPLDRDQPEYFIWGPIPFTIATQEMIYTSRDRMLAMLDYSKSPLLGRINDRQQVEGEQVVMISNRLFPHRVARGYPNVGLAVVEEVDGQPVHSLRGLVELLRDAKGEFIELRLGGSYPTLVFDRKEAEEATEEVLADEGIRHQGSPELVKVWETPDAGAGETSPAAN